MNKSKIGFKAFGGKWNGLSGVEKTLTLGAVVARQVGDFM